MDGDSGDAGKDELTCVRSDESDKCLCSVGRRSSVGSWFYRQGDAWRKERLLTFREEDEGGRENVTTSEERVLLRFSDFCKNKKIQGFYKPRFLQPISTTLDELHPSLLWSFSGAV